MQQYDTEQPGWSRWSKYVSRCASSMNILTPELLAGLGRSRKSGGPPSDRVLAAGRWIMVEWRRRTFYRMEPREVPDGLRI